MKISDFDFQLPDNLIAQIPAEKRRHSRLLYLDGQSGELRDRMFAEFPEYVRPGDVMVFNDTRVIKARLFATKESGGKVEVLVERILDERHALAMIRASKTPKPEAFLRVTRDSGLTVLGREDDLFKVRLEAEQPLLEWLDRHGSLPLPPYISRVPTSIDESRYQTVYAAKPGAVAAPTAGLHFDEEMLAALRDAGVKLVYVTLHVGAGTFQPVRVDDVREHQMHSEWYHVPQETVDAIASGRAAGGRVLAVGTTSLRALESAAGQGELQSGYGDTNLFILPGYKFRVVDRLLTNFHLPKSTLFMLVCAFGGMANMKRAYRHAVDELYRFFSYGDAMLIERQDK